MFKLRLLFFLLLISGAVFCEAQSVQPVSYWENRFLKKWEEDSSDITKLSTSNDSWKFYDLSYSIDGFTTMFEATGKPYYLDRALALVYNMINSSTTTSQIATSQYKDRYKGWVNKSHPQLGNNGKEYPLYESYCWRYVTALLKVMKNTPSVNSNPTYKSKFSDILAFTEQNIYDKWIYRGQGNVYRSNTHMFSHWARISMDLWCITKKNKYKVVFSNFDNRLRKQINVGTRSLLKQSGGALFWSDKWDRSNSPGQDVSHGNAVVATIIELFNCNQGFNKTDIDNLINLLDTKIWLPNKYSKFIDGSGKGNGWFTDGFIKLGRFDAILQQRIEKHTIGRNIQYFGNGALNAKILKNGTSFVQDCKCE